jgi:Cu-processing system permease protein
MLNAILLLNPTDTYRMLNLAGSPGVSSFSGMAGLAESQATQVPVLMVALSLWIALPLAAAAAIFSKREL